MNIAEAMERTMEEAVKVLIEESYPGGRLEGVRSIVRGDRHRGAPDLPAIYIFPTTAVPSHTEASIAETWTLGLTVVPVLASDDPEQASLQATLLAARAGGSLISGAMLRSIRDFAQDVRSSMFEPSGPRPVEKNLYGASYMIEVIVRTKED